MADSHDGDDVTIPKPSSEEATEDEMEMLYKVYDAPPFATTALVSLQHTFLGLGANVALPLLLVDSLCMNETSEGLLGRSMVIGSMIFTSGLCTIIQSCLGIRLPIMQGASFTFIPPILAILNQQHNQCPSPLNASLQSNTSGITLYNDTDGQIVNGTELWQRRIVELQGSLAVASIFQIGVGMTGIVGKFMKFVSPITISVSISLVAASMMGAAYNKSSPQWGVAFFTAAVMVIMSQVIVDVSVPIPTIKQKFKCGFVKVQIFKMFPFAIAYFFGWLLCFILTKTNVFTDDPNEISYLARTDIRSDVFKQSVTFRIPYPLQWGRMRVTISAVAGMLTAVASGIIESLGDYYATARISGAPVPPNHAINRGILAEGFGCLLNSLIGTTGAPASFSSNSAIIGLTRVGSRIVMTGAGCILVFCGLFGKVGAIFVAIPNPVIGGSIMVSLSMLLGIGISNLQGVNLRSKRNIFIIGTSLFVGLMIPNYLKIYPKVVNTGLTQLDDVIKVTLGVSMLVGGCTAMFFDIVLPGKRVTMESVIESYNKGGTFSEEEKEKVKRCYNLPFSTSFKFAKYLPFLPEFDGY